MGGSGSAQEQLNVRTNPADPYIHCYKDTGTAHSKDADGVPSIDDIRTFDDVRRAAKAGSSSYGYQYLKDVDPAAGPDTSPLSQLSFSRCVPVTTQLIPLIHSEMLKLS